MTDQAKRLRVEVDIPITRRRRIHSVFDALGKQLFHCQTVSDLLGWLAENDYQHLLVIDADAEYHVDLVRAPRST